MKKVIECAFAAKKKMVVLALGALMVANVSAQEQKKNCFAGEQFSKEERVEFDIKRFTHELMLSDKQAEKFAATYREYAAKLDELFQKNAPEKLEPGKELTDAELDKLAKKRFEGIKALADLQSKYYDKFRKDLSARQVEKVLRLGEPFPFDQKPCCGKQCGKHGDKQCGKHAFPPQDGFDRKQHPDCGKHAFPEGRPGFPPSAE